MKRSRAKITPYGDLTIREDKPMVPIDTKWSDNWSNMHDQCMWMVHGSHSSKKVSKLHPSKKFGDECKFIKCGIIGQMYNVIKASYDQPLFCVKTKYGLSEYLIRAGVSLESLRQFV